MTEVVIAPARAVDAAAWSGLRAALWPGEDDAHRVAIAEALGRADPERLALLARAGDEAVGFAEASIRHDYVNGCDGSPVAFIEGLYVSEGWRRRGIAGHMVAQVAAWGRAAQCHDLASDAPIGNEQSILLHEALGFTETERVVFFRKALTP